MIKRVVQMVLLVLFGVIAIEKLIVPLIADVLEMPGIETWTGLGGFLHFLPFGLLGALLVVWVKGLMQRNEDDD